MAMVVLATTAPVSPWTARALTADEAAVDYNTYAASYDQLDGGAAATALGLDGARAALVGQAKGRVLEIGVGTGLNLAYYQWSQIDSLTLVDISPGMLTECREKYQYMVNQGTSKLPPIEFVTADATKDLVQRLGSSQFFDSVVDTFSLCVMGNVGAAQCLDQLKQVARGRLLLLENTRSAENRWLAAYQDVTAQAAAALGGKGCVYNQDAAALIRATPELRIVDEISYVNGVFTAFVVDKVGFHS